MELQEKFVVLNAIGLTRDEALMYAERLESENISNHSSKIDTPCRVVYIDRRGKINVMPYLDLSRTREVWGVVSGGVMFRKTHESDDTYADTSKWLKTITAFGREIKLPPLVDLRAAYQDKDNFNATMDIFRRNSIAAENWREGLYLTADCPNNMSVKELNFTNGYEGTFVANLERAHVRLCL